MSNVDKLFLGVPAIAGGIPILINIYTTITVLFLVLGFYIGVSATVEDKDMKTALAALSGLRRARRLHPPAMDEIPAPVAQISDRADRQHLLPQHQQ